MKALIEHKDRIVRVDQVRLVENALAETYLSADIAAASSTLTIKDISGFSTGKYVWINPFGSNSEVIAVHASTGPTGNTLTLAANTAFAHSAGERVYYIEFNQIEISHSATSGGSKSVLSTESIIARERELRYLDTSQTDGFYYARFNDLVGSTFGAYSDEIAYGGWSSNTVGYMIDMALRELSLNLTENVTLEDCVRWVNKGIREIKGKVRKWPEHYVYDYIIGQAQRGQFEVSLPADIYDAESNASIEALRVGDGAPLSYIEPSRFDEYLGEVKRTEVRTQASATDTSLALDNSYDFEDSGSVSFYISGTKHTITYTGVTRDDATGGTAALTGIPASGDGSITVTVPVDTAIWQDEAESNPLVYTVRNGQIEYWPMVDASKDNQNIYLDYNTAADSVDSEADVIDYLRFDMLQSYLTWRIWCKAENSGQLDKQNGHYSEYKEALNDAIRTMIPLTKRSGPRVNSMRRRGGWRGNKADPRLLPNEQQ